MEHNTIFRVIYTLILGIVIAFFFGIGVQAFYEAPKAPEYPRASITYKENPSDEEMREQQAQDKKFEEDMRSYDEQRKPYERNVAIILMSLAVVTVVSAFVLVPRIGFLSDGVLLGGLFTVLHSIVRGMMVDDTKFLFVMVTIAVVVVLALGYRRFISHPEKVTSKK